MLTLYDTIISRSIFSLLALMKQGRALLFVFFQAAASVLQSRGACWEQNGDPYFNNVHPVFSLA